MGEVAGVLRALDCKCCSDFQRFVANSAHLKSKCSDCCELTIDTDEIDIPPDSEEELEVGECLKWHKK